MERKPNTEQDHTEQDHKVPWVMVALTLANALGAGTSAGITYSWAKEADINNFVSGVETLTTGVSNLSALYASYRPEANTLLFGAITLLLSTQTILGYYSMYKSREQYE